MSDPERLRNEIARLIHEHEGPAHVRQHPIPGLGDHALAQKVIDFIGLETRRSDRLEGIICELWSQMGEYSQSLWTEAFPTAEDERTGELLPAEGPPHDPDGLATLMNEVVNAGL